MAQLWLICQTLFLSVRTLEYVKFGEAGFFGERSTEDDEELDLDWDIVPIMLIFDSYFLTVDVIAYLMFDAARELNTKIFNEFVKLRGKSNQSILIQLLSLFPLNKMPSLILIGVLLENDVKFHDNSMDFFHKIP